MQPDGLGNDDRERVDLLARLGNSKHRIQMGGLYTNQALDPSVKGTSDVLFSSINTFIPSPDDYRAALQSSEKFQQDPAVTFARHVRRDLLVQIEQVYAAIAEQSLIITNNQICDGLIVLVAALELGLKEIDLFNPPSDDLRFHIEQMEARLATVVSRVERATETEVTHQEFNNSGGIVVTGAGSQVYYQPAAAAPSPPPRRHQRLADQRQKLFFEFFRQALSQAETTFRVSIVFVSGGAAIVLTGAILALAHSANPSLTYLPLITALSGTLITTGGGALAVHANRARKHLSSHATDLSAKIEEDHKLEKAETLISRVEDQLLRDRLTALTAMHVLDMGLEADTVTNRILLSANETSGEGQSIP